jgi:hypothetical protein
MFYDFKQNKQILSLANKKLAIENSLEEMLNYYALPTFRK